MTSHHKNSDGDDDDLRDEFDFRAMGPVVRGKYAQRFGAQEPSIRILRKDGIIEEGPLSKMRARFGLKGAGVSPDDAQAGNVTLVAVPNELVPKVQELISHSQSH
jgi:hypothetical protein